MRMRITRAVLILVTAVSLVSCATPDPVVTAKIKAQMMSDEALRSSQIEVDTKNGVVTLTGMVETQAAKDQALRLAKETRGAVEVVDMISVRVSEEHGNAPEPDRTLGARIDDASITMRVKAQLLDDPVVKGTKIDVDTRNGVVYLTGLVRSEAEKEKAIELAKRIEGVRQVQANVRVTTS